MRLPANKTITPDLFLGLVVTILSLGFGSRQCEAGDLKIHGIWPVSSTRSASSIDRLYVVFETPVDMPAADVRFHCGFASDAKAANPWHLMLYDRSGAPRSLDDKILKACADDKS